DLGTIAHKLNVASVLEGSVRRSGHTVRVTAQLNNALTGFHLWSQTYDRDLKEALKLQTDIANAVANALKVTLLSDVQRRSRWVARAIRRRLILTYAPRRLTGRPRTQRNCKPRSPVTLQQLVRTPTTHSPMPTDRLLSGISLRFMRRALTSATI